MQKTQASYIGAANTNRLNGQSNVAEIIKEQIGGRALYMIGAKDLRCLDGKGLSFRIMRNSKKVTHVAIYLDPSDTYTIKYYHQKNAPSFEMVLLNEEADMYCDDLHRSIERNTGLYTSL
jgi:hypothetical protein